MHKFIYLIYSDLQNTRRDPTLLLMLFVPVLMIAFLRYALPAFTTFVPELVEYNTIIVTFFVVMNSLFPSFIIAFILLDEKDLSLFPVIRTTPLSLSGLLIARLGFIFLLGFASSWLIVCFNGLVQFKALTGIMLAFLSALHAPIITLLISTLAKNKVEGLTYLKAANLTLIFPLAIFFIDSEWKNMLAVFPAFWPYKMVEGKPTLFLFLVGVIYLCAINYYSFKLIINKTITT